MSEQSPQRGLKVYESRNVLEAAQARIATIFDDFPEIYLSFSGGKDSGVMFELVASEARRRGRTVGVLVVDLEAQYHLTVDYIEQMLARHADVAVPYWVCLPLALRNAVSHVQPKWQCWDPDQRTNWVRDYPDAEGVITDEAFFPFFRRDMEFEEFVPAFGHWFGTPGRLTASFVGIRADESLNRFRTIASRKKTTHEDHQWTTWMGQELFNVYPLYDWRTEDIWTFYGTFEVPYNTVYDRMHMAGMSIHQARICHPYGDDQKKGLWLYHLIEPDTWPRVLARVDNVNFGALYAKKTGNINGRRRIELPPTMRSWKEYTLHLLSCLPTNTARNYARKHAVFRDWYRRKHPDLYPHGDIPDEGKATDKSTPSWTRLANTILKNDHYCTTLSFSPDTQMDEGYRKRVDAMIQEWGYTDGVHVDDR